MVVVYVNHVRQAPIPRYLVKRAVYLVRQAPITMRMAALFVMTVTMVVHKLCLVHVLVICVPLACMPPLRVFPHVELVHWALLPTCRACPSVIRVLPVHIKDLWVKLLAYLVLWVLLWRQVEKLFVLLVLWVTHKIGRVN